MCTKGRLALPPSTCFSPVNTALREMRSCALTQSINITVVWGSSRTILGVQPNASRHPHIRSHHLDWRGLSSAHISPCAPQWEVCGLWPDSHQIEKGYALTAPRRGAARDARTSFPTVLPPLLCARNESSSQTFFRPDRNEKVHDLAWAWLS